MRMMRRRRRAGPRKRQPRRQTSGVDERLLRDVEYLAEVVAVTIDELHDAGLGFMAKRLEEALARLGGLR